MSARLHEVLLQEAMELLAAVEPGVTITQNHQDYGMNDIKVDLAFHSKLKRPGG